METLIHSRHIRPLACLLGAVVLLGAGCAYFNMYYNAQSAYREGLKLKDQNQTSQAKAKFDKAIEKSALVIKRWPKSRWVDDALFTIGASYYQEGQYEKSIRAFDQLGLAFPNSGFVPRGDLYRGLALLADKQYGTARVALDAVKQKYPRFADEATYNLAKSFLDRQELERGTDSLAAFLRRFPKSRFRLQAMKQLADGSFELKRYADAEKWYTAYAGLTDDPKLRALAKLKVAACEYELGKYDETIAQVNDVLGRYADLDDEANLLLGKALNATGRQSDAIGVWAKVKGASDLGAEAAFRIGKHYEEGADFPRARAYYDTAKTRRVDSDYGVQAVKRLALLDALAARTTGKKAGGDSLQPAEATFLLAEVNNLNLGDYDKAMELYQKVYDSFPDTDWAAKALFANAWILRNVKHDSAAALPLLKEEIAEYPETEYADESRRWLGLPVPKREKKRPELTPETVALQPPAGAPARQPALQPGPTPPEPPPTDTAEIARQGPGKLPHGQRESGRLPGQPELAGGPHGPRELPGMKPGAAQVGKEPGGEKPGAGPRAPGETPGMPERAPGGRQARLTEEPERIITPRESLLTKPETAKKATADSSGSENAMPPAAETAGQQQSAVVLQLEIAHFATDSWQIQPADSARLRADAESLKAHPEVKVTIVGHCDPRASEQYNRELGFKRAQEVEKYLTAAGVDAARITVRSDGEKRPISTKPAEYWLDRRVEFEYR